MKKFFAVVICVAFCGVFFSNPSRLDTLRFGAERPKIGVVLSGGGAKGMAHVGTLKMLETLNIPIDYIAGTSMGAIVGGLYAIGYTADQIDTIIRVTDWMSLFNDFPKREHIGVNEKKNNDPYQLRISLAPNDIAISAKGAIDGQHIDNMLNHYLFESYKTPVFSDLKIPFFCVATDLLAGEYVVLDKGNLARAIRASMAVPTVFTPVEIDGRLLADGGILNNFPVLEMRKRGVDIVIGVDVGYQYKDKSELQNFAIIFEQVMFLGGQKIQQKNIENCDILIVPDLADLGAFSFSHFGDILDRGYKAAQAAYPELSGLAGRLSEQYGGQTEVKKPYFPNKTIILDTVVLSGSHQYSHQYILQRLQLETRKTIPVENIEDAIHRLFGMLSFTKITYHFERLPHKPEHAILHITLVESPLNTVKVGFRYDNIRGPSLLAGIAMRNPLFKNSKFDVNLDLSALPIVDLQYQFSPTLDFLSKRKYPLWNPTLLLSYTFFNLKVYDYRVLHSGFDILKTKVVRDVEHDVTGHRAAIASELNVRSNTLGFSLNLERTTSNEHVGGGEESFIAHYWYPQFYYIRNSFDKKYYPTKGSTVNARTRWMHSLKRSATEVNTFATYYIDAQYAIPLSKRVTLYPSGMIAGTVVFTEEDKTAHYIGRQQQFHQGGLLYIPHINQSPFVGLYFIQKYGLYAANVQINTQYELFKNFFLTSRIGALKSEMDYSDMFDLRTTTFGAGISASFNTTIGPIGVTVHGSNQSPVGMFFNLGFWL
jgi:NTE family protein